MQRTILVTGFTGRLGGLVARALRDHHSLTPRILVRPARRAAGDWEPPAGMKVVISDYDKPETLDAALAGVDAVFLVSSVHPDIRRRELARAARASRSSAPPHVVKISGLGTRLDSLVDSGRWHAQIERGIASSDLRRRFCGPSSSCRTSPSRRRRCATLACCGAPSRTRRSPWSIRGTSPTAPRRHSRLDHRSKGRRHR